jgi:hypothetical protein
MKLAREIGGGVLVSGLFLALVTVWPIWAALLVVIPYMGLLVLAATSEHHDRHSPREVMPTSDSSRVA